MPVLDPGPARGFSKAEFAARLEQAQRLMHDAGLAALMLTTEPEVRWFSGFLTQFWQSPTRPWFLVVPVRGKPVAVVPSIGAACMGRTWIEDIRTWSSPDPEDDGISLLAATLREVAGVGTVGLPTAISTKLLLEGKIPARGVHIPVISSIYDLVLAELETAGIIFEEKTDDNS